jgi:(R,R)-butanediol dehydrogenase / meso-butanediol dehydrogenase / diacetyl reductase
MRAAVVRQGGRVHVEDVPEPRPSGRQVALRVIYCGICGSDLHALRAGSVPEGAILGHEIVGEITAVGPGVRGFATGDRVTTLSAVPCDHCDRCEEGLFRSCRNGWQIFGYTRVPGGYAETLLTHASIIEKVPESTSDEVAAFNEPAIVGLHAVRISRLRPGDTAVIIGAGPVGLLVLQAARLASPGPIYVVEPSVGRRKVALELGASACLDPFSDDVAAFLARETEVGPDVVFECAGAKGTLQNAVEWVRPGGQVMVPGVNMEPDEISPLTMIAKECEIKAALGGGELFADALKLLSAGQINVLPMVSRIVSLDELDEVLQDLGTPACDDIKVLVAPGKRG